MPIHLTEAAHRASAFAILIFLFTIPLQRWLFSKAFQCSVALTLILAVYRRWQEMQIYRHPSSDNRKSHQRHMWDLLLPNMTKARRDGIARIGDEIRTYPESVALSAFQSHVAQHWPTYQDRRQQEKSYKRDADTTMTDTLHRTLELLVVRIMRDFVFSWYNNFSADSAFPLLVESCIFRALFRVRHMVRAIDWEQRFMSDFIPTIILHMRRFKIADLIVRGETDILRYSSRWQQRVLQYYHPHSFGVAADKNVAGGSVHTRGMKVLDHIFQNVFQLFTLDQRSELSARLMQDLCCSTICMSICHVIASADFANHVLLALVSTSLNFSLARLSN